MEDSMTPSTSSATITDRNFSDRDQSSHGSAQGSSSRPGNDDDAAAMPPPRFTSRQSASGQSGYASITFSGASREHADSPLQPVGRVPVAGQSHAHRPVSAMPTINTTRAVQPDVSGSKGQYIDSQVYASMGSTAYADRRASAQPTLPSLSQSTSLMAPPMGLSPSAMDSLTNTAITQGVPITSPAALQYFAAHPRRQQVHFGNYLLLQTLGEGEFGKVKLGVHKEWGEEVAVKLIKRDKVGTPDGQLQLSGPAKDPAKMSKVEKEIRVLKDVRHPNIVRLYEVIESDRYIGIVLEYASGGELFDHILAHKYLRERDACRLFAQLVSGVNYLHHKKIVHRDLKLENLLLDRNRNVIITDFGFANNFENKRDDLMATSCGSPCYAAPELVVQDGLYAGSAVDVWSCGVILYAMLAGYLPFDDDPANPDGDNINLLYKYIMATPLSFPDYITAEPRDLLCVMLVPDPQKRATLEQVMGHSWLAPYRDLFKFTVDELERAAIEQQNKKRQVYRQQMLLQQQLQEQRRSGNNSESSAEQATLKQQRHRSALAASTTMPDRIFDPIFNVQNSQISTGNANVPVHSEGNMAASATLADFAGIGSTKKQDLPASVAGKKNAGAKTQRHTVQLEYHSTPANQKQQRQAEAASPESSGPSPVAKVPMTESKIEKGPLQDADATSQNGLASLTEAHNNVDATNSIAAGLDQHEASVEAPPRARTSAVSPQASAQDGQGKHDRTSSQGRPNTRRISALAGEAGRENAKRGAFSGQYAPASASKSAETAMVSSPSPSMAYQDSRTAAVGTAPSSTDPAHAKDISEDVSNAAIVGRKSAAHRRKAMSLIVGKGAESPDKERERAKKSERRLTARLRKETAKETYRPSTPKRTSHTAAKETSPSGVTTSSSFLRSPNPHRKQNITPGQDLSNASDSNSTVGPSSSAAKKVMDWFRKRSLNRAATDDRPPLGPFEVNKPRVLPGEPSLLDEQIASPPSTVADTPQVVVTAERDAEQTNAATIESSPSSRSTSGTHSQVSQASESTGLTAATGGPTIAPAAMSGQKMSSTTVQSSRSPQATPRASAASVQEPVTRSRVINDQALRVHQGAVDQSALTSRRPTDVFDRVQRALWDMGIETRKEPGDDFKLECYRRKRAKTLMGATQGFGQTLRTSVFPPTQADYERSVSNAGSRSPGFSTLSASMSTSPSTAGSIRSFLRRSSNQQSGGGHGSSAGSDDGMTSPPAPMYGEPAVDGGQEVRFSVEVTRIRNLPGLYSVDIRRMKGNLWAYKWVYHTLLDRCQLSGA